MPKNAKAPDKFRQWVEARQRFGLSDAHVQMARELGLNPRKLGGIANPRQEPGKLPLPEFIDQRYLKQYGKQRPDRVQSLEERARELAAKQAAKRERKHRRKEAPDDGQHPQDAS